MSLRPPTETELRDLASDLGFALTDDEAATFHRLAETVLSSFETVSSKSTPTGPPRDGFRDPGSRVQSGDPYNAWITRCEVRTDSTGRLDGWRIGVKDNIQVAGVEMTCGSRVLEGYVPATDATVVDRILEDGGEIVGKTNMDSMAFAGDGHSSSFGPTRNPCDDAYVSGGSSGGSAAAVAAESVDAALGTDQGGSVRVPAAWTGVVGYKPTHGLVPYTGCVGFQPDLDHVGILAPTVESAATLLSVLAGRDDRIDPRQPSTVPTESYETSLSESIEDRSIAVIEEGFDRPGAEQGVNDQVRAVIDTLEDRGATVETVSVPLHELAQDLHTVGLAEGYLATLRSNGLGHNRRGWHDATWARAFGSARQTRGGEFPPAAKLTALVGAYANERYQSTHYADAMNLRTELTRAYEALFESYDLVAMPATPMTAIELEPDHDPRTFSPGGTITLSNACAFNITGHPSISVPAGISDGLPVGLLLTGSRFADAGVLSAAHAVGELDS